MKKDCIAFYKKTTYLEKVDIRDTKIVLYFQKYGTIFQKNGIIFEKDTIFAKIVLCFQEIIYSGRGDKL